MKNSLRVALIILLAAVLRLYNLGSNPPSLYWDEASLGYNASSIVKTGFDEHHRFLPLTNFAAYGDYKPPLYIYATVPAVAILGLTEFAIRFPSALFGTLTVLLTYLLAKKLFEKEAIAQLSALFMAISPWHLQFSRGAFEGNLGLFFSTLGIYLFVKFAKDKSFWIFPSLLSFTAAMYTFTGQRLFVPLIALVLLVSFRKEVLKHLKPFLAAAAICAVIFWPLFKFATETQEGQVRFNEVSIFNDLEPINESVKYRQQDNYSLVASIIHNRRINYAYQYLTHYFDAFNPSFLFFHGDVNPRLSIQEVGELYYFDLPLVLAGIYLMIAKKFKYRFLILFWLLISPLGPATARETPHALRMIHILPTFQLIAAFGAYQLYEILKAKKVLIAFALAFVAFNFLYYLHMYHNHWPRQYATEWQYGYKQLVGAIEPFYKDEEVKHIVTNQLWGRQYIYFLLYLNYDPQLYWKNSQVETDQYKFIHVRGFDKFSFEQDIDTDSYGEDTVFATTVGTMPYTAISIAKITGPDGRAIFDVWRKPKIDEIQK